MREHGSCRRRLSFRVLTLALRGASFRQPDEHFMVVLNDGCEDFRPIRLPQSGDVDFEIVQGKAHVADRKRRADRVSIRHAGQRHDKGNTCTIF